jgi:hypothetical protein
MSFIGLKRGSEKMASGGKRWMEIAWEIGRGKVRGRNGM